MDEGMATNLFRPMLIQFYHHKSAILLQRHANQSINTQHSTIEPVVYIQCGLSGYIMSIVAASLSLSESEQGACFRLHRGKSSCMPGAAIQPVGNAISYTAVALSGKTKPY